MSRRCRAGRLLFNDLRKSVIRSGVPLRKAMLLLPRNEAQLGLDDRHERRILAGLHDDFGIDRRRHVHEHRVWRGGVDSGGRLNVRRNVGPRNLNGYQGCGGRTRSGAQRHSR